MNLLAFDLGASSGKLFLATINNGKTVLQDIHRFEHSPYPISGGLYWDIINIYKEMNIGIQKAVKQTDDQIDSFAIDSFSNDFGLIDKNGSLLSPVRCYRDERSKRFEHTVYEQFSKEKLYRRTGNQIASFNTLIQLAAMKQEGQDYFFKEADKLLFIPDLLNYFMTGIAAADYTLASVSQMYDMNKDEWCHDILDTFQIPETLFAPVKKPGNILGRTSDAYNKFIGTKGFPVAIVCGHDTASAYLSAPNSHHCALISCGTWALVGTELSSPVITPEGYQYNLANEGTLPGRHRLLRNVMSSWLIQECREYYKNKGHSHTFPELEAMAANIPPFQFLFDPDSPLFYQPGNMPEKIQACCKELHTKAPETPGEVIRCIYENLAMKFRWTIERLEQVSSTSLPTINMVGGGSCSKMLCQFTANATNKPVIAGPYEASAIGNLAMQMTAAQPAHTLEEALSILSTASPTTSYYPQCTLLWNQAYKKFLQQLP